MRPPCLIYFSTSTGVRTGCHYSISMSVSVCMCNINIFHYCKRCTRPASTNAGIYGSGRVWANARDVPRRMKFRGGRGRGATMDFVVSFRCDRISILFCVFVERTRHATRMRPPCLLYLSTSNEARPRDQSDRGPFFPTGQTRLFIPGCVQGANI